MNDGNNRPGNKRWSELTSDQVRYFYERLKERADALAVRAEASLSEFAKFLFAANTGSAAGIFFLLNSKPRTAYLVAFFLFCAGSFFVGIAHFIMHRWYEELSDSWSEDMNAWGRDEMPLSEIDKRHKTRLRSFKRNFAVYGHYLSLGFLIAGAVTAGLTIWALGKN